MSVAHFESFLRLLPLAKNNFVGLMWWFGTNFPQIIGVPDWPIELCQNPAREKKEEKKIRSKTNILVAKIVL